MIPPGPYVIVPFLRPSTGGGAALWVRASHGATEVMVTVVRANGQVAARGQVGGEGGVVGQAAVSCAAIFQDLYALADCGAVHLSAADDTPLFVELRAGGSQDVESHLFGDADTLAGTDFRLAASDATEPFAVLANGGDSELFVFVNDNQGPFIPPGGAARVQIPSPGGPLHLLVESGDGVLAYRGACVPPST